MNIIEKLGAIPDKWSQGEKWIAGIVFVSSVILAIFAGIMIEHEVANARQLDRIEKRLQTRGTDKAQKAESGSHTNMFSVKEGK